jgi:hypothetical protein
MYLRFDGGEWDVSNFTVREPVSDPLENQEAFNHTFG